MKRFTNKMGMEFLVDRVDFHKFTFRKIEGDGGINYPELLEKTYENSPAH